MLCATIATRAGAAARICDRQPPVVIVKFDREALRPQIQLQPQVREQHHTERHDGRNRWHAQRREPAALDVERVEPEDIVWQWRRACQPQL